MQIFRDIWFSSTSGSSSISVHLDQLASFMTKNVDLSNQWWGSPRVMVSLDTKTRVFICDGTWHRWRVLNILWSFTEWFVLRWLLVFPFLIEYRTMVGSFQMYIFLHPIRTSFSTAQYFFSPTIAAVSSSQGVVAVCRRTTQNVEKSSIQPEIEAVVCSYSIEGLQNTCSRIPLSTVSSCSLSEGFLRFTALPTL